MKPLARKLLMLLVVLFRLGHRDGTGLLTPPSAEDWERWEGAHSVVNVSATVCFFF